ncbi:hypothetical protein WCX72_09995 [Sulfurimonas sp. HSL1-6]|uniref:hypothetical protein n=1 Tax=Thiomicrolovo immobilis TaxID=3131935 RepID=UPI0031F9C933
MSTPSLTTTITALPTPPSSTDKTNFKSRADAFVAALPTMGTEYNAGITELNQAFTWMAEQVTQTGNNVTASQLRAWESEAERLTAESYATEPEDVPVKIYTSVGDGTFTATPTNPAEYSALHYEAKAAADSSSSSSSATSSQLRAWESEAEHLTAESYATEPEDVPVKIYTSVGDGTFTATPTNPAEYSALHYEAKAAADSSSSSSSATSSQLRAWESEAERLTAESYATEPEDVPVKIYTSVGDGTFTATPTNPAEYSALHHDLKAAASAQSASDDRAIVEDVASGIGLAEIYDINLIGVQNVNNP